MSRPEFIDNRDGNTLAQAINAYVESLDTRLAADPDLDVVTGYFNPNGYFSISDALNTVGEVRLLLGAEPPEKDRERWRKPGEPRGDEYDQTLVDEALQTLDEGLQRDRDLLGFSREIDENLREMVDWLESDSVEVRRFEEGFVHGKAYTFSHEQGVIAGSSNFTGAGLNSNLELNLGSYNPSVNQQVEEWFEDLWEASDTYDLAALYDERFEPYHPYLIYLRVLYARYGDELEEEREEGNGRIDLTTFQDDGVRRAHRFLDEHNGVIIADEVGLGKTFIAGKLLERTIQRNRQKALVVAPAYLRDGMWSQMSSQWGIQFDIVSYSQLRNDRQLGGDSANIPLHLDEYQLVVIDEAHAFRNPGTDQSDSLRQLLRGDPPKNVVMLTATPVNNSLWDLYYLLNYFIKNDAAFASEGIPSLRERFKEAQQQDPSDLSPDLLFDVLDKTTVRRTRRFIKNHYPGETIPDGEGGEIRITFPDVSPRRLDYTFRETFSDDYFDYVARGLAAGDRDDGELTLARYQPSRYIDGEEEGSELSLVGLLRTGLLKRFESSSRAFATTLNRMIRQYEAAVGLMDEGHFPATDAIDEWIETDNDEAMDELLSGNGEIDLTSGNVDSRGLKQDLESDLHILREWYEEADKVTRDDDEKLHTLGDELQAIVEEASSDATNENSFRQNRKVLIFSYFEDTVDWIYDYLTELVEQNDELENYRGRIAAVAGGNSKNGVSRKRAVQGFAPDSTDAPEGTKDEFDILVTTDVLGQGVNLQQARYVINYDLPWNPMRVVQRNGRIDRINSAHPEIYPYSVFPDDRLDDLLKLEHRVREKLTQAARSIGIDNEVIPDMETMEANFSDKVQDIDSLQSEEADLYEQGGKDAAAYSGEEYRQELRQGLKDREDEIVGLPWGAGSGFRGPNPGYFFCARIGEEVYMRFVPKNGEKTITDTLTCLTRIECNRETDREVPDEMRENIYNAWKNAREDMYRQWMEQTDPRNIEPDIRKLFRDVGQHLREYPPNDVTQKELEKTIASVEAPWGRRYERELRDVFDRDLDAVEKSRQLIAKIEDLGLQPFEAPEPLPPIQKDEVKLVCWMVVAPEEHEEGKQSSSGLISQMTLN